jgi:hypothetical protein
VSLTEIKNAVDQLSSKEFAELIAFMRDRAREANDIPQDFIDALADFDKGQFVSMETALKETPPDA